MARKARNVPGRRVKGGLVRIPRHCRNILENPYLEARRERAFDVHCPSATSCLVIHFSDAVILGIADKNYGVILVDMT